MDIYSELAIRARTSPRQLSILPPTLTPEPHLDFIPGSYRAVFLVSVYLVWPSLVVIKWSRPPSENSMSARNFVAVSFVRVPKTLSHVYKTKQKMANKLTKVPLFLFLSLCLIPLSSEALPLHSLVTHIPGFDATLPSKHYSGYFFF